MTDPYTPRTDSTQLPSAHELLDILTKESQRKAVRFDFIQRNNVIFGVHRKLSKLANSDDSWIDQYRELPLAELVSKVDQNHAELARYIQEHPSEQTLYQAFYRALIPNEKSAKTDAIFVFGAASNARIERAIELYNDGIAQKIIISGNSPHYLEGVQSEASRMADFAIEKGIPKDHLILEQASVTLPDNVKRTIDLFEVMNWRPAALTIVATNFVLTRATMEWYKFCPWDITIVPVAAYPQSSKFTAEGWYNDSSTIALVLNDYAKIVLESKIDLMRRDGEIA
jgi:uncharacterized SAM-binding protein YcdF (DUF218 family)